MLTVSGPNFQLVGPLTVRGAATLYVFRVSARPDARDLEKLEVHELEPHQVRAPEKLPAAGAKILGFMALKPCFPASKSRFQKRFPLEMSKKIRPPADFCFSLSVFGGINDRRVKTLYDILSVPLLSASDNMKINHKFATHDILCTHFGKPNKY